MTAAISAGGDGDHIEMAKEEKKEKVVMSNHRRHHRRHQYHHLEPFTPQSLLLSFFAFADGTC